MGCFFRENSFLNMQEVIKRKENTRNDIRALEDT